MSEEYKPSEEEIKKSEKREVWTPKQLKQQESRDVETAEQINHGAEYVQDIDIKTGKPLSPRLCVNADPHDLDYISKSFASNPKNPQFENEREAEKRIFDGLGLDRGDIAEIKYRDKSGENIRIKAEITWRAGGRFGLANIEIIGTNGDPEKTSPKETSLEAYQVKDLKIIKKATKKNLP